MSRPLPDRAPVRFDDPGLERAYWHERVLANRTYYRTIAIVGLVLYPLALVSNELGRAWPPIPASEFAVVRAWAGASSALALALLLATSFVRSPAALGRMYLLVPASFLATQLIAFFAMPRPHDLGFFMGLGVQITAMIGLTRLRFGTVRALAAATLAAFLAGSLAVGDLGGDRRAGLLIYVVCALVLGLFVAYEHESSTRLAFLGRRALEAQSVELAALTAQLREAQSILNQELGHQVAARSRELGRMLASATMVPGRPKIGERFDARYRVVKELGAGAMGAVFEVVRSTDDRRLAVKVVTGEVSADRAARFAREAEIGARIRHENVVEIIDVGVADGGVPYLAMELAPGGSLEARRTRFGDAIWARPMLRGIAAGLCALHEAGVVHRDLKPANVLLTDGDVPKISDFGISRFGELDAEVDPSASTLVAAKPQALTATGMLLGTPYYMAPEAVRTPRVEPPADVFAFGILAVEMLTGRAPFSVPPMFRVLAGEPLEAPLGLDRIELPLRELVAACLSLDPVRRPSMRRVREALEAHAG